MKKQEQLGLIHKLRKDGKTWAQVGKALGMTENQARLRYRRWQTSNAPKPPAARKPPTVKPKAVAGRSMDDFRANYDFAQVIREKVQELLAPEDANQWWTDDEFRQLCGISIQNWRRHAELDEFRRYQFKKGTLHAWAPLSMIEEFQHITGHVGQ